MKYTLTAIALAAAILAGWQNRKLRDLHETEATHLATQSIEPSVSSNAPEHGEVDPPPSNRAPLSEAEMTVFVASVIAEKVKFETGLYHSVRDILETTFPAICQTLERVTPAQLGALVDAWPHTAEKENDRNNGIYRFLLLAAELNPSATAELSISPLQKEASQVAEKAMKYWFKRDLPDFLKWARENDI